IDYADFIVINKFERKGSEDARNQVRKQYQRSHLLFEQQLETMPVYGTIASQFNDPGTNTLFAALVQKINEITDNEWNFSPKPIEISEKRDVIIPVNRQYYLREIVETVRTYHKQTKEQVKLARQLFQLEGAMAAAKDGGSI